MRIEWTDDLVVGVNEIDEQHEALFTRINAFFSAIELGDAKEGVLSMYDFLAGYVSFHFETEENHMRTSGFAGLAAHTAAHAGFTKKFQEIRGLCEAGATAAALAPVLQAEVVDWWPQHIRTLDKELGSFLQEQLKKQGL